MFDFTGRNEDEVRSSIERFVSVYDYNCRSYAHMHMKMLISCILSLVVTKIRNGTEWNSSAY